MEGFFRQLLKPINLLHLTLAGIALFLSFLYKYDGLGLIAISPAHKTELYRVSHFMTGLVLTILGIRLIIEYEAKWCGSILLLLVFVGISGFDIIFHLIPTEFWVHLLTTGRFQQFIDTIIWVGWILPVLVTAYIAWRWYARRHN